MKSTNTGDAKATLSWFEQVKARKARVHPEHPDFVETCKRCIDFRASLFGLPA